MASESLILREARLELGKIPGVVLWRNNVGSAEYVSPQGDVMRVAYGLCPGSSDLVGMLRGGRFLALEFKTEEGRATKQQMQFINLVNRMGGVAEIVRSADQAVRLVTRELARTAERKPPTAWLMQNRGPMVRDLLACGLISEALAEELLVSIPVA